MTGGARSRLLKLAPALGAVMLFAASCASDAPQDTLKPEGPAAQKIDNLIKPIFGIAGVVMVLVLGGALFIAWKFRARDDDDFNEMPKQIHGHFKAEIGWTIAPALLLAVIGAFTVNLIFDLAQKPEKDAVQVEVYGQQWWWEYRYDLNGDGDYTDIITANDLVIPAGREVALKIKSRDVIHSWWSPRLNGKKDAVPGRVHPLTIEADDPGEYIGQCTEFCGLSHAEMRIKVVAVTEDEFSAWTEHQQQPFEKPTDEAAINGWGSFAGQCTSCHELTGMIDPSSADDPSDATDEFVFPQQKNQVSNAAPNLAHFMTRSTFAGAMYDLRKDTPECTALGTTWASTDDGIEKCLNRTDLEAWLRDAPAMKHMAPGDVASLNSRGMPNFDLSEDQIDDLVAFLTTLK
ncbi:MAG: cytochrome c oxidase subunit II [Actinobacteria bacterium]|nr:cytochrome c oxidase subunit II [Actinomycetota bacterium]